MEDVAPEPQALREEPFCICFLSMNITKSKTGLLQLSVVSFICLNFLAF